MNLEPLIDEDRSSFGQLLLKIKGCLPRHSKLHMEGRFPVYYRTSDKSDFLCSKCALTRVQYVVNRFSFNTDSDFCCSECGVVFPGIKR